MRGAVVLGLGFVLAMVTLVPAEQPMVYAEGEITAIDDAAQQIVVDGVTVAVTPDTVILQRTCGGGGGPGEVDEISFGDLAVGQTVKVCGLPDEAGILTACKIMVKGESRDSVSSVAADDVLDVVVVVAPNTFLLDSVQSDYVVVHAEIAYGAVNTSSVELNGIAAAGTKPDSRGELVAFFDEPTVKELVAAEVGEGDSYRFTLTGETVIGQPFSGSDDVQVKRKDKK